MTEQINEHVHKTLLMILWYKLVIRLCLKIVHLTPPSRALKHLPNLIIHHFIVISLALLLRLRLRKTWMGKKNFINCPGLTQAQPVHNVPPPFFKLRSISKFQVWGKIKFLGRALSLWQSFLFTILIALNISLKLRGTFPKPLSSHTNCDIHRQSASCWICVL